MSQADNQGSYEAPSVPWDAVCDDVKSLILGKLSLCELARAAPVCQEFRQACLTRAAEEQASLIAAAEETYGKSLFSSFVTAFRRTLLGGSPLPGLICTDERRKPREVPLVSFPLGCRKSLMTNTAEPKHATMKEVHVTMSSDERCAVFFDGGFCGSFEAFLTHTRAEYCSGDGGYSQWRLHGSTSAGFQLNVLVTPQAAAFALGILLAARLESPEGLPAFCGVPFETKIQLWVERGGATGLGELKDTVAPLRSLRESVTIVASPLFRHCLRPAASPLKLG